jgi:hypothetical protein
MGRDCKEIKRKQIKRGADGGEGICTEKQGRRLGASRRGPREEEMVVVVVGVEKRVETNACRGKVWW